QSHRHRTSNRISARSESCQFDRSIVTGRNHGRRSTCYEKIFQRQQPRGDLLLERRRCKMIKIFDITTETQRHRGFLSKLLLANTQIILLFSLCLCASAVNLFAQETPPAPAAPKTVTVPAVRDSKLANDLPFAPIDRKS